MICPDTKLNSKFQEVVYELFTRYGKEIRPLYPWVLVAVFPKATKEGSLYLPEKRNKLMYEGIVMQTWSPVTRIFRTSKTKGDQAVVRTSDMVPGDVVVFPHWAGYPAGILDEREFRLIKEWDDALGQQPAQIVGKITFGPEDAAIKEVTKLLTATLDKSVFLQESTNVFMEQLTKRFHIVPKNYTAQIRSGL